VFGELLHGPPPALHVHMNGHKRRFSANLQASSKLLKINRIASILGFWQGVFCQDRDFCPNKKCQRDRSVNPYLHWAIGFRTPPAGRWGAVFGFLFGSAFLRERAGTRADGSGVLRLDAPRVFESLWKSSCLGIAKRLQSSKRIPKYQMIAPSTKTLRVG